VACKCKGEKPGVSQMISEKEQDNKCLAFVLQKNGI
jgi:hypothetical protein